MGYILVGNYGVDNLGDEALKEYFLKRLPDVNWKVLSARPKGGEYPRIPLGIRSFFKPWWKTINVIRKSDDMVFGGGTLFTDIESPKACLIWWWHGVVARIFRKKLFLTFQGIGPFKTRLGEWLSRWIVKRASFISVRDSASANRIESWKRSTNVIHTFDPVISLIQAKKVGDRTQDILIIIPRHNSGKEFLEKVKNSISLIPWQKIKIISMQPKKEFRICMKLMELSGGEIVEVNSLDDLIREISSASRVLSHRYHGALIALALGKEVETVSQGEGDKLEVIEKILDGRETVAGLRGMVKYGEEMLVAAIGRH